MNGGGLNSGEFRRWPFVMALVTAFGVFPLLFVGAGVTSKDAGMAYPDWPTSSGHLINPPQWWEAEDTRWEHGHRLIGWAVGFAAILLAITAWSAHDIRRHLALATLLAIVLQGVLGGIRVIYDSTGLAMLHGIWGQICFCLAALTALRCSRWWATGIAMEMRTGRILRRLCIITTTSIFVQLALGSALRHFPSGHALVAHVLWAMVVIFLVGWVSMWIAGHGFGTRLLRLLAQALGLLTAGQLLVGGLAWLVTMGRTGWSGPAVWLVPTIHVGMGALVLVCSVLLTAAVFRRIGVSSETVAPVHAMISLP
jgi:cytochrome c oxidase assembly protein subunit 15